MNQFFKIQKIIGFAVLGLGIASPAGTVQSLDVASPRAVLPTMADPIFLSGTAPGRRGVTFDLERENKEKGTIHSLTPLSLALEVPQTHSGARFEQVMQYAVAQKLYQRPMGEIMQAIAEQFLGTPYVAGLLDQSNEETLVLSLDGFDCVLFVETVLAIARGVAIQDYSYQTFSARILDQRYRNGELNGYCSRLHYFSEWISDNQKRGTVENITQKVGGIPLNTQLNFMSQHRDSYLQLASDDATYQCIVNMEAKLNTIRIDYVPKNQIYKVYSLIKPGDIVATTADIEGLDVTHTGLVYRYPDGSTGFIHASPSGEVKISRDLQGYVESVEGMTGIVIARPLDLTDGTQGH